LTVISTLSPTEHPVRRVIIAGGGNLGLHLAELVEPRYLVRLIERDPERCRHLAGSLRRTIVLNGDVTDAELMKAEGIAETDVFCSATHEDKTNIVSSILARRLGARTTLSIVNHAGFGPVSGPNPNDIIISPAQATIGALLTHIRRGDIRTVYSLRRGTAEAIELVVHGDRTTSNVVGRRIGDLPLDEGVALCAILRQNQLLFPDPETEIESLDRVVLFLPDKQFIANVELLFQVAITFV
jgi:trk system potassium uptake protein TrkA